MTYVLDLTQLAAGYPDWHIWQSQAGRWWATRVGRVAAWDTHDDPDFAMTIDADSLEQLAKELEYQTNTLLAVFALPFWRSTTGALVLPAVAASAAGGTHTLAFVSVQGKSVMLSKASGGQQDTDVNAAGKTVGFDMLYFVFTSGSTGAVSATIETTGGFLYATFTFDAKNNTTSNGKVTGGTGAFAGATGTIKTKSLNAAGTRTAVTVTYRG